MNRSREPLPAHLVDREGRTLCLCPSCQMKFARHRDQLDLCAEAVTELEGGKSHPIEEFEELRLVLASFLKKELLDTLLALYKELSKEPRQAEMYAWFVRNSQYGGECRYAQAALKKFKESRLDQMENLLRGCLDAIEKLRE